MMWGSTDEKMDFKDILKDIEAAHEQIKKYPYYGHDLTIKIPRDVWEWERWRLTTLQHDIKKARLSMEKIELEKWLKWYNLSKLGRRVRKRIRN